MKAKVEYDRDKADYEAKYGPIKITRRKRNSGEPVKRKI
jgi:hypothetical protein